MSSSCNYKHNLSNKPPWKARCGGDCACTYDELQASEALLRAEFDRGRRREGPGELIFGLELLGEGVLREDLALQPLFLGPSGNHGQSVRDTRGELW